MREMTATEVARSFSAVLDDVAGGESFVVTRGGERVATIAPTPRANGAAVLDVARRYAVSVEHGEPDPMVNAVREMRSMPVELGDEPWRD